MPNLWDKNVPNRKKLNLQLRQRLTERLDIPSERKIQPFSFFGLTSQADLRCDIMQFRRISRTRKSGRGIRNVKLFNQLYVNLLLTCSERIIPVTLA